MLKYIMYRSRESDKMDNKYLIPIIIFGITVIILIIALIILKTKRKNRLKKIISELDYEKNKLIGVPILSELSKVRELVKTDDLRSKLAYWDETFNDIKENKIDRLTDLISEADFELEKKDYNGVLKRLAKVEIDIEYLQKKKARRFMLFALFLWEDLLI